MDFRTIVIFLSLCAIGISNVRSTSLQFSSKFYDLSVAIKRYTKCLGDLPPLKNNTMNDTDFLINEIKLFLDQSTLDNDHWSNVTNLLDTICQPAAISGYRISVNIDVNRFHGGKGKLRRCQAIDDALNYIYSTFKRARDNSQEPLDFSEVKFYQTYSMKQNHRGYNLSDLVNTLWIKSETSLDHVCGITDEIKSHIQRKRAESSSQDRSSQVNTSLTTSIRNHINRMLDTLFGIQRRLYWDSINSIEQVYMGLSYLGSGIENHLIATGHRIVNLVSRSNSTTKEVKPPNIPGI